MSSMATTCRVVLKSGNSGHGYADDFITSYSFQDKPGYSSVLFLVIFIEEK